MLVVLNQGGVAPSHLARTSLRGRFLLLLPRVWCASLPSSLKAWPPNLEVGHSNHWGARKEGVGVSLSVGGGVPLMHGLPARRVHPHASGVLCAIVHLVPPPACMQCGSAGSTDLGR